MGHRDPADSRVSSILGVSAESTPVFGSEATGEGTEFRYRHGLNESACGRERELSKPPFVPELAFPLATFGRYREGS